MTMDPAGEIRGATTPATESGVALLPPGGGDPLGVSPLGCVNLARAVLAEARLLDGGDGHDGGAWSRAAADPAVAAWLEALRRHGAAVGGSDVRPLPAMVAAAAMAVSPLGPEAALLLDVLAVLAAADGPVTEAGRVAGEARLEAVREFAYGAGHEINNPLANIAARAQSLLPEERDPERRRRLATIVDQAFRARDMIGGLMVYARPPKPRAADVAVDDVVRAAVEAVRPMAESRGLRIGYSPPPAPVTVRVDAAQVAEAVRALVMNAVEAGDAGGQVVIEAASGLSAGRCRIVVADDGAGMDPATVRRAFDPFFSGRDAGRGIGLGLPKALRLIECNGGSLAVESNRGRGTMVTVDLPLAAS